MKRTTKRYVCYSNKTNQPKPDTSNTKNKQPKSKSKHNFKGHFVVSYKIKTVNYCKDYVYNQTK